MNVVSDSSPLIALAAINSLDLLRALYGSIQIPDEVYKEVVVRGRYPATAVANVPWITRRTVIDVQHVAQCRNAGLDQGESEAIALALEIRASLLLVDELAARNIARQRGSRLPASLVFSSMQKTPVLLSQSSLSSVSWLQRVSIVVRD